MGREVQKAWLIRLEGPPEAVRLTWRHAEDEGYLMGPLFDVLGVLARIIRRASEKNDQSLAQPDS